MIRHLLAVTVSVLLSASAANAAPCLPQWSFSRDLSFAHRGIAAADFDGDAMTDLVSHTETTVTVRRNAGGDAPTVTDILTTMAISDIAIADVNGDGKTDILAGDKFVNTLTFIGGNGDGTFATPVSTAVQISPTLLATGDFTGDGKMDVAFFSYSANAIATWAGDGSGGFTETGRTLLPTGPAVHALAGADFDGDGRADLALTLESAPVHVRFGNAGGTFTDPLVLRDGAGESTFHGHGPAIGTADLDGDGDPDITAARGGLFIFRNDGSRAFHASAMPYESLRSSRERRLLMRDVTGDGIIDVVAANSLHQTVMTFRGNGDATFTGGVLAPTTIPNGPYGDLVIRVVAGQFDDDPAIDLVVANGTPDSRTSVHVYRANCRVTNMTLVAKYPVASAADGAVLRAQLIPPGATVTTFYPPGFPAPTGTVRFFEGDTEIGAGSLIGGVAEVTIAGLSVGTHAIRAEYSGDIEYDPNEHTAVTQKIVNSVSTTTLTTNGQNFAWGQTITLTVNAARSAEEGPFYGKVTLLHDGVAEGEASLTAWVSQATFTARPRPGTHTFQARYEGNEDHPPSKSAPVTVTVARANTRLGFTDWQRPLSRQGYAVLSCAVKADYFDRNPTGPIRLYQGNTFVAEATPEPWNAYVQFYLPSLAPGTHYFRCTYAGDALFLPAESRLLRHDVLPYEPLQIKAIGELTRIGVWWFSGPGGPYEVFRRVPGGPWVQVAAINNYDPVYFDYNAQKGVPYLYRVDAVGGEQRVSSAVVQSMLVSFTDDGLPAGSPIRALHVTELAAAVNAIRTAAGLETITLSDAAAGQRIRGSHIQLLRDGLNEARVAMLLQQLTFTDPVLGSTVPVRASHIQQLRDSVH